MKAIMRGGPKDGVEIELDGKAESVRFPAIPDLSKPENWQPSCVGMGMIPRFGQIVYHRTERLEGDSVVFI